MSQMSGGYSTRRKSEREFYYQSTTTLKVHPLNVSVYGEPELGPEFVQSIKDFGVLEPILIARLSFDDANYSDYILSGHRRFAAAQQLGIKKVPVREWTLTEGLRGPIALLDAEAHIIESNRQRVKTESLKDAEAAALLRIETELAKERLKQGRQNLADPRTAGKAVEKVAAITGESSETVRKRAEIHAAAVDPVERNQQSTNHAFENLPKPTACDICQASFESKGAMKDHRRKVHAEEMAKRMTSCFDKNLRSPVVASQEPPAAGCSTQVTPLQPFEEPPKPPKNPEAESQPNRTDELWAWFTERYEAFSLRPTKTGGYDLTLHNLTPAQVKAVGEWLASWESK